MVKAGNFRVSDEDFHWYIEHQTHEYLGFSAANVDILRIVSADGGFDIALMLRLMEFHGGSQILLASPMVVLGEHFPNLQNAVAKGARIRVRPRISVFPDVAATNHDVRRIVEWCRSRHFRAVRCNIHGLPQTTSQDDYSIGAPGPRPMVYTPELGNIL